MQTIRKFILVIILVTIPASVAFPNSDLTPNPHPRLFLAAHEPNTIKKLIEENEVIDKIHSQIITVANRYLSKPTLTRVMTGKRLLSVSREALKRISYLSYSHRLTGKEEYARRAIEEMVSVANFADWNPKHFLDVAEMTLGLAIGYDWLNTVIPDSIKPIITEAIKDKALTHTFDEKYNAFLQTSSNWNAVCNSGLVCGAISVFEEYPDLAEVVIKRSLESNQKFLDVFSPDGAFPEGYNYWDYGVSYEVLLLDALESAFEKGINISSHTDFLKTPEWMLLMSAPSGKCFNFSDSQENRTIQVASWWFAEKKNNPSLVYPDWVQLLESNFSINELRLLPLIPIFASRLILEDICEPTLKIWSGKGTTPVFMYRGGWDNASDTYLGIKGGSPSIPHAHMDAGSFVYEKDGIRWAMDLGTQDYNSIENRGVKLWNYKQDGERWNVMRMRNEYHNTLTINDAQHNVNAYAGIIDTFSTENKIGATVDLTEILGNLKEAKRTVFIDVSDNLNVIDSIKTDSSELQLLWVMQTPCHAYLNDNKIVLQNKGQSRIMSVDSDVQVKMVIMDNNPLHDYDAPVKNVNRVGFTATLPANTNIVIKVSLDENKK